MSIADIAEMIARKGHQGQFRRDGVTPYITHPERVKGRVTSYVTASVTEGVTESVTEGVTEGVTRGVTGGVTTQADFEAVAWLHDILEDTSETEETLLAAGIPQHVVEAVKLLTKKEGQPYEEYLSRLNENELARTVKINDMLDNLSGEPTEKQIKKYARGLLILHGEKVSA